MDKNVASCSLSSSDLKNACQKKQEIQNAVTFFKPTSLKFPYPVVKLILNDSQCRSLTMRVGPSQRHDVHRGGGTSWASPSLPESLWERRSCNHPTGLSPRPPSNLPAARAWLKQWLCVFLREKGRKGWEKEKTRVSHVADAAQSSEASILNCSVQWHETYGRGGGGVEVGVFQLWFSPPLRFVFFSFPLLSSNLLFNFFSIRVAWASPASLRNPGCLSHCGAFSPEELRPCCSASTRGSACIRLLEARAGGSLRKEIARNENSGSSICNEFIYKPSQKKHLPKKHLISNVEKTMESKNMS